MNDPREAVADVLRGLADTLRHHRDLGLREIALERDPFPDPADALGAQEQALQGCPRCKLSKSRSTVVFGSGNARARLMVIGEGPGEEEDKQGKPFVGRAGQLLTRMLASVGFDRERDCYIANVIKCRPERNRNPEPDEVAACNPFLMAQIDTIQPHVILALGNFAAQTLLGTKDGISKLRGRIYMYRTGVLVPTFHPAFLLRNPGQEFKRMAWDDLKAARREYDRLTATTTPQAPGPSPRPLP
ncbi:MAG TPA: uracil-DNA glycosylase [Methylomirabilota bacterium]|jgi:DNA polymerase|nr:uracil-DNA glycosylase [Methylomirabilota bacterium]